MADEQTEQRRFSERALDAIEIMRPAGLTSLRIAQIKHERKAANPPDFSAAPSYDNHIFDYYLRNRSRNTAIDYRGEVGALDGHSLVACVVNYTGTRLPEAKPAIKRTKEDGDVEIDSNHALARLIRRPNNHHVWSNYALACSCSWWVAGNIIFKKVRDVSGQVVELWYVPHYLIKPRWPGDNGSPA